MGAWGFLEKSQPSYTPIPFLPCPDMRIAHISDVHFGKIAHPGIVPALIDDINGSEVDLVVVSGDVTQRARRKEFKATREMLDAFDPPSLVIPGNHDVYAWWYLYGRIFNPLRRFQRLLSDDMTPSFEQDGVAVLGINSAHGRTIKNGRIRQAEREAIRTYFADKGDHFKVLAVHHHLTEIEALGKHDVVRGATATLELVAAAGIDLVLCGHLHISHVEQMPVSSLQHPLVVASAGTATSSRGRKTNRNINFYNRIDVAPAFFEIEERRFSPASGQYVFDQERHRFER